MSNIKNVLVGSDPEFFIKRGEEFFPSFNIIDGTKDEPTDIGGGYQILKDNVLLEGNIPPAKSREEFIHNLKFIKDYYSKLLQPHGLQLSCNDSGSFAPRYLRHWEANLFGCSPFMNCWDGEEHVADDMSEMVFRVAGFHIHIGYDMDKCPINRGELNLLIAKAFDYFVVNPARAEYNDEIRAKYYGSHGNFRNKPYGLECRSLGGYFLQDKYLGWVYDNVIKLINYINEKDSLNRLNAIAMNKFNFDMENYDKLGVNFEDLKYKK
jgi:hypothetical protein